MADDLSRADVLQKVREHLSTELEVPLDQISESTRLREDLDADSLDLYELVMELEDTYGVSVSEEEAAHIETVGHAVDFVAGRAGRRRVAGRSHGAGHPQAGRSRRQAGGEQEEGPRRADRRAAGGPAPPRGHALLLGRPSRRLVRAPGVPGGRRPRAGRRGASLPALPARGHRAADQGPRPGRQWARLRRGRARARAARDAPGGRAGFARGRHRRRIAARERARHGLGLRGGDLLRGHLHHGFSRRPTTPRSRPSPTRSSSRRKRCWTSSQPYRSGWRGRGLA